MKKANEILEEVLRHTKTTKNSLAKEIGLPRSQNLYDIESGKVKKISAELSEKITDRYPEISRDYLKTGEGRLLKISLSEKSPTELVSHVAEEPAPYLVSRRQLKQTGKKQIPFYDASATAGSELYYSEMTPVSAPAGTIDVGDLLNDSECALRVYGNSMIPNYPPGCVVGLIRCTKSFIEPGEVYVIETQDRRVIKRLFYKNDDPDTGILTCYSDNILRFEGGARDGKPAYPIFNIKLEDVVNLYQVTGVIKRNSNSVIINR